MPAMQGNLRNTENVQCSEMDTTIQFHCLFHHSITPQHTAVCLWEPSGLKQLSHELVLQHSSSRSSTEQTHLRHNSAPVSPTAAPTPRVQCSHFASPMSMLPPVSHFKKTPDSPSSLLHCPKPRQLWLRQHPSQFVNSARPRQNSTHC